jgi:DNA polymerase-4
MTDAPVRKILHIDMDAFYASVEQRDHPQLKGLPVAVGHPERRGVVTAASYEARAFGVRSAMPSATALRLCRSLIFTPPRFEAYQAVSREIHEIFSAFTDLVEPLSLDEAYLDVTENRAGLATAAETAREIRGRIFEATQLTASAGVSYNKILAKLASGWRKPDGQLVIAPGQGEAFIQSLPVERLHGVGPVTAAKMRRLGLETGADLRRQSRDFLTHHFGKAGGWYFEIARGRDPRPVQADRLRKSSGAETTFRDDRTDVATIERALLALAQDVWAWRERTGLLGRTVTVKLKWANFQVSTRARTLSSPIVSLEALKAQSTALLRSMGPFSRGVRLVGVSVSNLVPAAAGALAGEPDLFSGR